MTVSELNAEIKAAVERGFASVWVEGEVVDFRRAASGHWYFNLNDGTSQVKCVCWKGTNFKVRYTPVNGNTIRIRGRLSFWEAKGELKLTFEKGAFAVHYYDRRFPISPRTYGSILGQNPAAIARSAERHDPAIQEYRAILRMADDLQGPDDPGAALPGGAAEAEELKQRLAALASDSPAVRQLP